jgi:radical SAM superfamily enzyme YgiQ (UPF0313 family)
MNMRKEVLKLLNFYIKKLDELKPDFILFSGPFLWEKAPSYSLAAVDTHLRNSNINSLPIDLNLILYHYFGNINKSWTNLKHSKNENLSQSFFQSDVFTPLWRKITEISPNFIGLSISSSNEEFMYKLNQFLLKKVSSKFIVGGPAVFFHAKDKYKNIPSQVLKDIDSFVPGEVEYFDPALFPEVSPATQTGIALPNFTNFPLENYPRKRHLPLMISRGCTSRCTFCSECLLFKGYSTPETNEVFSKLDYYINSLNVNWFTFYDSLINGDLKQLDSLVSEIIKKRLNIKWEAQCLIRNDMTIDLIQKMKKSGCFNLFIGMESACDNVLKGMNKRFRKKDIVPFFKLLKDANLHFEISLIVGFPGETDEDFQETLKFLEENKDIIPKIAQINPFIFYPHTKILKSFPKCKPYETFYDTDTMLLRVQKIVDVLKENQIPFTDSYINNLIK